MRIQLFLAGIFACLMISTNISAQRKVIIPSDRKHRASNSKSAKYFFRGEFGVAYGKTSIGSFDIEGFTLPADICMGIGVMKNIYFHGMFGADVFTDTYKILGSRGIYEYSSICIYEFGGGLTIYAIPEWLYLSGSVTGNKTVRYPVPGISDAFSSQPGIGFELKLGTSIMITRYFGVGLSGFMCASMMNDAEVENEVTRKIKNSIIGLTFTGIIGKL